RDALQRRRRIALSRPLRHPGESRRRGALLHDLQGARPRGRRRRLDRDRAWHARLFPSRRAAPAELRRRPARLLRDPGVAQLQDDHPERGAAGPALVLRAYTARRAARGVEPELAMAPRRRDDPVTEVRRGGLGGSPCRPSSVAAPSAARPAPRSPALSLSKAIEFSP